MREELLRMWADARPAVPYAAGLAVALLVGMVLMRIVVRSRVEAARRAEAWAAEQLLLADCISEPTGPLDMAQVLDDRPKLVVVLDDLRQRAMAAVTRTPDGPDWTEAELAAVKALTDRGSWPTAANYQRRGLLPRLRIRRNPVPGNDMPVTPKTLAERIKRIRAHADRTGRKVR